MNINGKEEVKSVNNNNADTQGNVNAPSKIADLLVVASNYVDDAAAAAGGIAIGGLYHNAGAVKIRIA